MIKEAIQKVVKFESLSHNEAADSMKYIMDGNATEAQVSALITALRMKGETVDEISGFAATMRSKSTHIRINDDKAVDTCGTGGDGKHTLNVSTISAFVAAGAGITVAKHGNRSVSSKCGSADLLSALGVKIDISPEKVEECIDKAGIGFLFAPMLHKAMRYAVNPRKEIAIRTVFNILGPLTNPARVKNQLLGVFDAKLTEPLANVLLQLGSERAFVVHGNDGLDEISVSDSTTISELKNGRVDTYSVSPEDFGIERHSIDEITGGEAEENKNIAERILQGEKGAGRDIIIMNAAAAISASDPKITLIEGAALAIESIDSGKAMDKVKQLIDVSNS
ncbi:anthranilate phosphoribosyltransferase [candidate division KSB1 bacterium]